MPPSTMAFLIVCPMVFLAGLVDSIGGGGGLISLPAYLFAGLPAHAAIATNKMSATFGTAVAAGRFAKNRMVDWKLALPTVCFAFLGAAAGAKISLMLDEKLIRYMLVVVLPAAAFFVLNPRLFRDAGSGGAQLSPRQYLAASLAALVIGAYDGMYGPGTGTFLIIALTVFAKLDIVRANAQTKVINLVTNVTSLVIFLLNGQVVLKLGLAAAVCNMAGNYIGSGLAMKNGSRIVRPIILAVLALLLVRILTGS